tara:strand:- start:284 stop:1123 length:840 start_codon:yes stop_codon:yes gene_type:complete
MQNPLEDYYRQKEIYIPLPTQGLWYENKPNLTNDGEIGVLPMTLNDEMLLNIPDTLYNGESIFNLMKSIVPDIIDPAELSLPDVDVILLASRAMTYDKKMQVESKCTHCENFSSYEMSIPDILSQINLIRGGITIELEKLQIELRPNTLKSMNAFNIKNLTTTQLVSKLANAEGDRKEELSKHYMESLREITIANIELLSDAIVKVTTPDGKEVTDQASIQQWLANAKKSVLTQIENNSRKLNLNGLPDTYDFTCSHEECGKEFKGIVEFNPSFFFSNS